MRDLDINLAIDHTLIKVIRAYLRSISSCVLFTHSFIHSQSRTLTHSLLEMRPFKSAAIATLAAGANAASLTELCSVSNVQAALPSNGTLLGIDFIPSSVQASV